MNAEVFVIQLYQGQNKVAAYFSYMIYDILTLQNTHLSQFWRINCLRLNEHLMNLLYISRYITSCWEIRRTSTPCSGSFIYNSSIFGASAGCKHLSKRVAKMQSSHWCTVFQDLFKVPYDE